MRCSGKNQPTAPRKEDIDIDKLINDFVPLSASDAEALLNGHDFNPQEDLMDVLPNLGEGSSAPSREQNPGSANKDFDSGKQPPKNANNSSHRTLFGNGACS